MAGGSDACDSQSAVAEWLRSPAAYPHGPERVEVIETHISLVFLAGERVYKLKKSVKFDFLDFSTLARREEACREEVQLNRRLAGEVYLGVVPVTRGADGGLRLGGAGEVVEWLVEMERLPTERTLDALVRRDELTEPQIDALVEVLARFYRGLSPLAIEPAEYRARIERHVRANRTELLAAEPFLSPRVVQRVHGMQLQWLALQLELFDERVRSGRIVEGHGDLRPEHICFRDPIAIFDCIEFSPEFRQLDVADELAFLAAECDFLGAGWAGARVLERYQQTTSDRLPAALVAFYKSYRACVRAKVAALRAGQLSGNEQQTAVVEAQRHLQRADEYVQPYVRPRVIAVGGLSGTGKTTLARAIAEALGAELLRTDVVRQDQSTSGGASVEVDQGRYAPERRAAVYDALFAQAREVVKSGVPVVLDGTFSQVDWLRGAADLVRESPGEFLAVECVCRAEVAQARIVSRLQHGQDASEARPEVHNAQRESWQAWPHEIAQMRVDTELPIEAQLEAVLAQLRR